MHMASTGTDPLRPQTKKALAQKGHKPERRLTKKATHQKYLIQKKTCLQNVYLYGGFGLFMIFKVQQIFGLK